MSGTLPMNMDLPGMNALTKLILTIIMSKSVPLPFEIAKAYFTTAQD